MIVTRSRGARFGLVVALVIAAFGAGAGIVGGIWRLQPHTSLTGGIGFSKADFCYRVHENLDDLRTSHKDFPTGFVDRVDGANWFVVNAIRFCTGLDGFGDLGGDSDPDRMERDLAKFEKWLERWRNP